MRSVFSVLLLILILLIAGALVNLTIAWSAAKWSTVGMLDVQRTAKFRRAQFAKDEGSDSHERLWIRGVWGNRWLDMVDMNVTTPASTDRIIELRAGWPWRIMSGNRVEVSASPASNVGGGPPSELRYEWAMMTSGPDHVFFGEGLSRNYYFGQEVRYLPLKPIWPNALISSAVFPVFGALVLLLAWLYRTAIRWSRGWCIKCGYDLRGRKDAGCPECGWRRSDDIIKPLLED